jgi:hypothetical protein
VAALMRPKWRVLAVDVAEQRAGETVWRIRVRTQEKPEPTYVVYVSQRAGTQQPYGVGQLLDLDARLLNEE